MPSTRVEWPLLTKRFTDYIQEETRSWIGSDERHFASTLEFAMGRLAEGRGVGEYLLDRLPNRPIRCLDVGGGSGGVATGLSNYEEIEVHSSEIALRDMHVVRAAMGVPFGVVVSPGDALPFGDATFDAVVFLETLEHVKDPRRLGAEIMRILKPGGLCMLTTPARLKYLFGPDPHYGVPGLLLLPDALQPLAAKRFANVRLYDVEHIYWTQRGVASEFPGARVKEVFWNAPKPYRSAIMNALWSALSKNLWDRIVLEKIS